jgi:hypothetical protein
MGKIDISVNALDKCGIGINVPQDMAVDMGVNADVFTSVTTAFEVRSPDASAAVQSCCRHSLRA